MAGGWARDGAVREADRGYGQGCGAARAGADTFGRERRGMRRLRGADPEEAARGTVGRAHLHRLPDRARQSRRAFDHQPERDQRIASCARAG